MVGRKDALLTLIVAVAVLIVVANVRNWQLPLVAGDRATVAALAILALLLALAAPPGREPTDAVTTGLDVLGVGVIFLVAAGLAIGTHLILALLTSLLALIWLLLTIRHLRRPASGKPNGVT